VKTQVDRDLTTVSIVDRQLRLIKNLRRHSLMVLQRQIPKVPLVGVYPSLGFRGILVFWLASI
jgi:hypothetical protein